MRGYPERTLATRAKWLLLTRNNAEVSASEWVGEMEAVLKELANAPEPESVSDCHVYVHVSGLTGSGKSAVAGEIEIAMRAIGLDVEWVDSKSEKRLTHADYTSALELYRPKVHIFEKNIHRTAPPAPSVPVLTVECEPDYWSGGHYHEGTMTYIDPTAVWKLPIGTKLYTAPPAPSVPDADLVIDLKHASYDALTAAARRSKWIPPEYVSNDWIADCINFLENGHPAVPADMVRDAERYRWLRKRICFSGNGDGTASMHAINLPNSARFPEVGQLEAGADAAIDAAIERDKKGMEA